MNMLNSKVGDLVSEYGIDLKDKRLMCCVSGGADSMAMLGFFHQNRDRLGLDFVCACHLNHGMRGEESDSDERMVRDFCAANGIELITEKMVYDADDPEQIPSEDGFREYRYSFFERAAQQFGSDLVATGHTLNDDAETLIFRLARGTGLRGASGIPAVRDRYIRPLLFCTREETEEYCRDNFIPFCIDSSNETDDYSRNVIRHHVIPVLKSINSNSLEALRRFSAMCAEADSFFEDEAEKLICSDEVGEFVPAEIITQTRAPLSGYIVRRLIRDHSHHTDRVTVERCISAAVSGSRTELGFDLYFVCSGGKCRISRGYERKVIEEVPFQEYHASSGGGSFIVRDVRPEGRIPDGLFYSCVDYDKLIGVVSVRNRRDGDRFTSASRKVTKSLKKLFNERGYSASKRDSILILTDESGIVWVEGEGPAKGKEIGPGTKKVIEFHIL